MLVRYNRTFGQREPDFQRSFQSIAYARRLRILAVEGVRDMYFEYALLHFELSEFLQGLLSYLISRRESGDL